MNSIKSRTLLSSPATIRGNQVDITMKSIQKSCLKKSVDFLNGIFFYRASKKQKMQSETKRKSASLFDLALWSVDLCRYYLIGLKQKCHFQFQTLFPMVYFFFFSAWAIIFLDFQLYQVNPSQTILNCNTCPLINNFYDLS